MAEDLAQTFQAERVVGELLAGYQDRMVADGFSEEEVGQHSELLAHFGKIAGDLIMQQPVLELQGVPSIEFDAALAGQTVAMFMEGVYHAQKRLRDEEVDPADGVQILQALAQEIFTHAKQVAATTYGQESTPDLQISGDQQREWITQAADSLLAYFLTELAKQKAAQEAAEQQPGDEQAGHDAPAPDEDRLSDPTEGVPPPSEVSVSPHQGPHPHDKYAAVAMLLRRLGPQSQQRVLATFNEQERQLIAHYANPAVIAQTLDVNAVRQQLVTLHQSLFGQGAAQQQTTQQPQQAAMATGSPDAQIQQLASHLPPNALMSLGEDERPAITAYLDQFNTPGKALKRKLPPKVTEVLAQHLQQQAGGR